MEKKTKPACYIISYPIAGTGVQVRVSGYGGPYSTLAAAIEQFGFFQRDLGRNLLVHKESLLRQQLESARIYRCDNPDNSDLDVRSYSVVVTCSPLSEDELAAVVARINNYDERCE